MPLDYKDNNGNKVNIANMGGGGGGSEPIYANLIYDFLNQPANLDFPFPVDPSKDNFNDQYNLLRNMAKQIRVTYESLTESELKFEKVKDYNNLLTWISVLFKQEGKDEGFIDGKAAGIQSMLDFNPATQPIPGWLDTPTILKNAPDLTHPLTSRDYVPCWITLLNDSNLTTYMQFGINGSYPGTSSRTTFGSAYDNSYQVIFPALVTSDGKTYWGSEGVNYTHTWDLTQDGPVCAEGYKTRYIITYLPINNINSYNITGLAGSMAYAVDMAFSTNSNNYKQALSIHIGGRPEFLNKAFYFASQQTTSPFNFEQSSLRRITIEPDNSGNIQFNGGNYPQGLISYPLGASNTSIPQIMATNQPWPIIQNIDFQNKTPLTGVSAPQYFGGRRLVVPGNINVTNVGSSTSPYLYGTTSFNAFQTIQEIHFQLNTVRNDTNYYVVYNISTAPYPNLNGNITTISCALGFSPKLVQDLTQCNLSVSSMVQFFQNLADRTNEPTGAGTIKFGSANLAKLTTVQIAIATNKNYAVS